MLATTDSFDLFTREGEELAGRLMRAISADIREDRLTRRQALDRAVDAMERVAAVDEGVASPEPVGRFAAFLNDAFIVAGFQPLTGELLREHFESWRRHGAVVSHTSTLPEAVSLVTSAARSFAAAAAPLFQRSDLKTMVAEARPWEEGFTREPVASAELVVCIWTGEATGTPTVCCVVSGPSGYVYLDQLASEHGVKPTALRKVLRRDDLDYEGLAAELRRLADATDSVNVASYLLNAPDRLSLGLSSGESGPIVVALWDGEPVASARQDEVAEIALASSAASGDIMREFRELADEEVALDGNLVSQHSPSAGPGRSAGA